MSDIFRGFADTLILAQLEKGDSYGYEINKNIKQLTDGTLEMKEATLYTTFRRLEAAGQILSYWGDESTGARRRYYAVTDEGKRVLRENLADWNHAKNLIDSLIKETIQ